MIDANALVLLPIITTNVSFLKPNIITTNLETNATIYRSRQKYVSTEAALVIMDPYELEALMRFAATISLNGLSTNGDTLIDAATSLNFFSKEFGMANGFYKDCKTAPEMAIRVASEQRISTTKVFCSSVFTVDGHEFTDLQFRVLPHFKSLDIILGLLALK